MSSLRRKIKRCIQRPLGRFAMGKRIEHKIWDANDLHRYFSEQQNAMKKFCPIHVISH